MNRFVEFLSIFLLGLRQEFPFRISFNVVLRQHFPERSSSQSSKFCYATMGLRLVGWKLRRCCPYWRWLSSPGGSQ